MIRRARLSEICELPLDTMGVDVKVELIQMLIAIGLLHVKKLLEGEVKQIAGGLYKRSGLPEYDRWGKQEGAMYLLVHKLPMRVPRVRDQR